MIQEYNLQNFINDLNNELSQITINLKSEKDTKREKLLIKQSTLINNLFIKIHQLKQNDKVLKETK
jgi:predicted NUDIX family phosphoesterase